MPVTLYPNQAYQLDVGMTPIYVPPLPATLYGKVTIVGTAQGIAGVQVEAAGPYTYGAVTDSQGNYEIRDMEPGTYTVTFTHADYETLVI